MINNLSTRITGKLLSNNFITTEEYELYIYGSFILFSNIMYLIFVCIFGFIFGCLFESIIFYAAFQFVRKYAGGYHASTETRCELLSFLSIAICIAAIRFFKIYEYQMILLFCVFIFSIPIFCFCPLDTPEKPLTEREYKRLRKISFLILIIILSLIFFSYIFSFSIVFIPCCMSLFLEAILILAGKIKSKFNSMKK